MLKFVNPDPFPLRDDPDPLPGFPVPPNDERSTL